MKPSELPLQARRPAIGLPRSVLIVRLYPPLRKLSAATSWNVFPPSTLTSSTPPSKPRLGSTSDASRLKLCRNVTSRDLPLENSDIPRIEPFVADHLRIIDERSIRQCISWRRWYSRIRSYPLRRRPLGIRRDPVLRQCRRRHVIKVFCFGRRLTMARTRRRTRSNRCKNIHSAPSRNIVWRARASALLVGDKMSRVIQGRSAARNVVTKLWPCTP